jgi:hypothetical protein
LFQKKEQIKKMKGEAAQNTSREMLNLDGPNSGAATGSKKGNVTPIAVVSFSDHNL